MTDENLPTPRAGTPEGDFTVLVTKTVLELLADAARERDAWRVMAGARRLALAALRPPILITYFGETPFVAHALPEAGVVVVMSHYPGWPHHWERYVREVLPYCTTIPLEALPLPG